METGLIQKGINARNASRLLAKLSTAEKNNALQLIADEIEINREEIKSANQKDLVAGRKNGLTAAFLDRLELSDKRIDGMKKILSDVIALKDPVGEIIGMNTMPNGLRVGQMRMPLGVIGIIFESRPNVCIEVASLTLKSGNGVILRGGSDAINSNMTITAIIKSGLRKAGLPETAVEVVEDTNRESIRDLVRMREYIDVIIPRGGLNLIRFVEEHSLIPVIRHDLGICHTYVDEFADISMAVNVCFNAKVQRPGVCNAMETLLVHKNIASTFLPKMKAEYDKANVELRGCPNTLKILHGIKTANEEDWSTEYLDLILSVKIVNSIDEAIEHINNYSSHHTDSIISENYSRGMQFITEVDSASCMINASTRFSDGNEFGLGAEMGISNQKLHVRGPMGLRELTSPKYIVFGSGQVRT